jgi:diacylglycerol kinase family enzyme
MDVGWVEAGESKQKHCFLGSMSLGLGVAVNRYLADFSYHHPRLSQWDFIGQGVAGAAGVFRAFKEKAVPCSLTLSHNGNKQVVSFSLLVFLNIDHYAGGLELNPGGSAFDGFIDCAVIDTSSTLSTVFFRHSVIKKKHMDRNEFTIFQSSRFGMESPDPVTIQLDGEVLGCGQRCEVGIFPRAIEVFTSL